MNHNNSCDRINIAQIHNAPVNLWRVVTGVRAAPLFGDMLLSVPKAFESAFGSRWPAGFVTDGNDAIFRTRNNARDRQQSQQTVNQNKTIWLHNFLP